MTASVSFEAIGVRAEVIVTNPDSLPAASAVVERELGALDLACSRFRADSELSKLNAAGPGPHEVSELLRDAIAVALRSAAATGGAVDPTVGRALRALGYDADFAVVVRREAQPRLDVGALVRGWRTIRFDAERRRVTIPPGVELDLGATAKAFAADRCAARAGEAAGCGVLVNLGGDLAVHGAAPPGGWRVLITDNHRSSLSAAGETVSIAAGGLATSSTTVRRWRAGGEERHHIVDPRTGLPATEHWRTVTVAAADCTWANTASTAAIVLGADAPSWLEQETPGTTRAPRPSGHHDRWMALRRGPTVTGT